MKRLVYFFVCVLMAISVAAQGTGQSGSINVSEADLNRIKEGKFVYEVEGVGQFVLSMDQNVSYEYSRPSIWGKKRHRLVLQKGNGSLYAESSDPSKKIQINRVSLSGYAYGSTDIGSVTVDGNKASWYTDGALTDPYVTTAENLKIWDACSVNVGGSRVSVVGVQVDYTIYDNLDSWNISDKETFEVSSNTYAEEIILDRTLAAGWNTICLPFDCHVSELGEGVLAQQFAAYDPEIGLSFSLVEQMSANVPYMIYCPEEIPAQTIVFSGREIYGAAPQSVSYNGMTFIGNYEPGFSMYGKYGVAQNKLLKGGPNAILNGTRAYFEYAEPAAGAMLRINYQPANNNGTTGIETVWSEKTVVPGVYNLQGARVRTENNVKGLPTGIYIVNGRKILVK